MPSIIPVLPSWSTAPIATTLVTEDFEVINFSSGIKVGSIWEFNLSEYTAENVTNISVTGEYFSKVYSQALLTEKTFYYNWNTKTLYLYLDQAPAFFNCYLVGGSNEVKTNRIPLNDLPSLFFNYFLESEVKITRSFNEVPSANIRLATTFSELENLNTILIKGNNPNTPTINLFGIDYYINEINHILLNPKIYGRNMVAVDISLLGKWGSFGDPSRSPLDFPYTQSQQEDSGYSNEREEIEEKALLNGGFLYYSDNSQPTAKVLGETDIHVILDADILNNEININLPGKGTFLDGIQLTKEYRNTRLNYKKDPSTTNQNETSTRQEFENCVSVNDALTPVITGNTNFYSSAPDLLNPESCFDAGGKTKTIRTITEKNGETVTVKEQIYGYFFTTFDSYFPAQYQIGNSTSFYYKPQPQPNLSPFSFWGVIETTISTYKYGKDNYLESIQKIGARRYRQRQESSALEAINTWIKILNLTAGNGVIVATDWVNAYFKAQSVNKLLGEFESYKFTKTQPIYDNTLYTLEAFKDYYDDINEQEKEAKENPDPSNPYIDPLFARITKRFGINNQVTPNPQDNPLDLSTPAPPLVHKAELVEATYVDILIPGGSKSKPEKYKQTSYTFNAEGQGGKNKLEISGVQELRGRPSVHSRIADALEPSSNDNKGVLIKSKDAYPLSDITGTGILGSPKVEEGSLNYNTTSFSDALVAARTQLSIDNTLNACTTTINIPYDSKYKEGDLVDWRGYLWLIISIDTSINIDNYQGNAIAQYTDFALKIGRLLFVDVELVSGGISGTSS